MPGDWPTMRLGEFARLRKGVSYKGEYLDRAGPRLLGLGTVVPGGGLNLDSARPYAGPIKEWQRIRSGEMLVALTDITQDGRVLGSPALLPLTAQGEFAVTHHVARVEITRPDLIDTRFLFYYLQGTDARSYMRGVATGTTVRAVSIRDAEDLATGLPRVPEQRAIAHTLGTFDDKIDLNRRSNETLEAMAQALFQSWFVDFDPVRAKAEGKNTGLPKPLADLFPESFEDSDLGEVPSGWKVGPLGEVAEHSRRGIQPDRIAPTAPYIALEHMPRRSIALSEWGTADGIGSNKFEFKRGEILFGKLRPYFHKVGVAPVDGVCSTDIVVVAPKAHTWFGVVLGHASSERFVEYTTAGSTGTRMPRTSWAEMARYTIVLPPETVAKAFTERVRPLVDRIVASVHESRTLAALRDTLLPGLVSGRVRLEDPGGFVEREL